jgi:hypothetical protein
VPNVRDDREAPLLWERDGGSCRVDLPDVLSGLFFAAGLDSRTTDLPVGQIAGVGEGHGFMQAQRERNCRTIWTGATRQKGGSES